MNVYCLSAEHGCIVENVIIINSKKFLTEQTNSISKNGFVTSPVLLKSGTRSNCYCVGLRALEATTLPVTKAFSDVEFICSFN